MFDPGELIGKFDPETRIVHLTARNPIRPTDLAEGLVLGRAIEAIMKRFLGNGRGYLLTDYSTIILEPKEVEEYSRWMRGIIDTYLYPCGYARYGFEISRINAQLAHKEYLGGSPNLFDSYEGALAYLKGLIAGNGCADVAASPPATAAETDMGSEDTERRQGHSPTNASVERVSGGRR